MRYAAFMIAGAYLIQWVPMVSLWLLLVGMVIWRAYQWNARYP